MHVPAHPPPALLKLAMTMMGERFFFVAATMVLDDSALLCSKQQHGLLMIALILSIVGSLIPISWAETGQWVKYSGNPVLSPTPGGWDAREVLMPRLLYDGTIFRMWYLGYRSETELNLGKIGYATSQDGIAWTKHPDPVLTPGSQGAWDASSVWGGSVIWNGSKFVMWYRGEGRGFEEGAVGLATSSDGVSWTKYAANPVLKATSIDKAELGHPYVIWDGSEYKMWYNGRSDSGKMRIFLATSGDGIAWTKRTSPVVSTSASGWDAGWVYCPTVIFDGSKYGMWYSAMDRNYQYRGIGYATSDDGVSWRKSTTNPILSGGPAGAWDGYGAVDNQGVLMFRGKVMLYYSAYQLVGQEQVSYKIGLAESPEGFAIPEMPLGAFGLILGLVLFTGYAIIRRRRPNLD